MKTWLVALFDYNVLGCNVIRERNEVAALNQLGGVSSAMK